MYYSLISFVAFFIHIVINFDVIFNNKHENKISALLSYKILLLAVGFFHISDVLWGILDYFHLMGLLYADTVLFFLGMGFSLFAWGLYVMNFFKERKIGRIVIFSSGVLFLLADIGILIANAFTPILFGFEADGTYFTGAARSAYFGAQIVLFLLTAIYAFIISIKKDKVVVRRYITIGGFGLIMAGVITLQLYFPLYPFYGCGCLFGTCLLHTFVVADEKNEYLKAIKEISKREHEKEEALGSARELAYKDPLTGINNKHAYVEKEDEIDRLIREGKISDFSIIVFDINDLKIINDTYGHQAGDKYIVDSVKMITSYFPKSEIYRFGGDEFVAILKGEEYLTRHKVLAAFNRKTEEYLSTKNPILATGISDFNAKKDNTFRSVFMRADENMYARKRNLKEMRSD